mgnify:FL=1
MKKSKSIKISAIVLVYNAETTILDALKSIKKQAYKVQEIIVIDNHSTDNSVRIVEEFKKNNKNLTIRIIIRDRLYAVSSSYNLGARLAKYNYLVTFHSDSILPSENELQKLINPFLKDSKVVASGSYEILPEKIWNKYGFWQKYIFANAVGKERASLNGKFDCYKKDAFLEIGGSDEVNFGGKKPVGGEDADLDARLKKVGKVVSSQAKVIHMHYVGNSFSLKDVLKRKWVFARAYGRVLRIRGKELSIKTKILLLIKPSMGFLPFIPFFHLIGISLLILFSIVYSWKMYITRSTILNSRILIIPFLNIFFVYYEIYWMIHAYFIFDENK